MFLPWVFVVVELMQIRDVVSQEIASCVLATFHWTFNSANQSPCEVASSLLGVCQGHPYTVQPLPAGTHYIGPIIEEANECQCSTVTYSLLSACGECQNRTISSWSEWSANCVNTTNEKFGEPIPPGVLVPGWAYLDVHAHDGFDATMAEANAKNLTESSALPAPSATATTTSSRVSVIPTSDSGAINEDNSAKSLVPRSMDVVGISLVGLILLTTLTLS